MVSHIDNFSFIYNTFKYFYWQSISCSNYKLKRKKKMFTRIFMYFLIITNLRANEEEETIDLKHLGPKLYGKPIENKNNGSVINLNFEEVGPYLEGDLLVPVSTRNGMKTESLRWKKAELPYIIRGRYSKYF